MGEVTGETAIMTETPSPCKARLRFVDPVLAKRMDEQLAKTEDRVKPEPQAKAANLVAEISDNPARRWSKRCGVVLGKVALWCALLIAFLCLPWPDRLRVHA